MIISFSKLGGGGGGYVLPAATQSTLGGIKVGSGLTVDSGGTLSVSGGSADLPVKVFNISTATSGECMEFYTYAIAHQDENYVFLYNYDPEGWGTVGAQVAIDYSFNANGIILTFYNGVHDSIVRFLWQGGQSAQRLSDNELAFKSDIPTGGDYIVTEDLSSITNPTEGMYAFVPAHMEGNTSTAVTYTVDGDFYDGFLEFGFDLTDTGIPIECRNGYAAMPYRFENGAGKIEPYFMSGDINDAIGPLTGSEWRGINGNGWGKVKLIESGLTVIFDDNVSFPNGLPDFEYLIKTVETGATTYVPDTLWFYAEGGWHRATLKITLNSREEIKSELIWLSQHTDYLDRIKLTFGNFEFDGDRIEDDYDGNKWLDHFITYGDGFKITYGWHPTLRCFIFQSSSTEPNIPDTRCYKMAVHVDSAGTETVLTDSVTTYNATRRMIELCGYDSTSYPAVYLIADDGVDMYHVMSVSEMSVYRTPAQVTAALNDQDSADNACTLQGRFFNYVTNKWRKFTISSIHNVDHWEWDTPTIVDE